MKPIIKIENVSKQYRLGLTGTGTFSHDVNRWWHNIRGKEDPYLKIGETNDRSTKGESDYVWALRDINFEVMPGEVLGIIGKNGAGKSTLLKLLSRVTAPTTGSIKARGRIASLLEVGTGFHPELTGRENVFLNGAIMGMTKPEIRSKFDEIVDFAGCERYIDTPVKRYSSGMYVRLAFAVAAHLEPDILVVDEVLAVGDAEFQKKAIGKMKDVSSSGGRTVLFVSHNMGSVKALCSRALVMSNGSINYQGETTNSIDYYLNQDSVQLGEGMVNYLDKNIGNEDLTLLNVNISDDQGRIRSTFSQSEEIAVKIRFKVHKKICGLRFNMILKTTSSEIVFATSSHELTKDGIEKGEHTLSLNIPSYLLNKIRYVIVISAGIPGRKRLVESIETVYLDIEGENASGSSYSEKWPGLVSPNLKWYLT